jgi:uncharacterized protein (DUF1697 family)
MPRYVALLRGVNLGARNRVPMATLRTALEERGYEDVRTLLQSGNVGVTSGKGAKAVREEVAAVIAERFGVETTVVLRTREELEALVAAKPLAGVADDPKRLQVWFLDGKPAAKAVKALEAADVAPEVIAVAGKEIHVWHAGGIQRSPASKVLERTDLGGVGTARNWNTVEKLLDLA